MRWKSRLFLLCLLALSACGGAGALPTRSSGARLALTSPPEFLELETAATRQQLFAEIAGAAELESWRDASPTTLFPIVLDGRVIAAPGVSARADLLQTSDGGNALQLILDGPTSPRGWSVDQRDVLLGLSEQEAARLVAGSLLTRWPVGVNGPVHVQRVTGTPYAAAYVDRVLQLNAAFVLMAAAAAQQ